MRLQMYLRRDGDQHEVTAYGQIYPELPFINDSDQMTVSDYMLCLFIHGSSRRGNGGESHSLAGAHVRYKYNWVSPTTGSKHLPSSTAVLHCSHHASSDS